MNTNGKKRVTVAVLGSLPPLRAISGYCLEFAVSMAQLATVKFISFKKIYPPFLYPGGSVKDDNTFPHVKGKKVQIQRVITWYNPFTWLFEGIFTRADILHAQWWSLPLFFIYGAVCLGFKLRGKPVVLTVHNVLPHEEKNRLYRFLSRLLFNLGDYFIVHSQSNSKQLTTLFGIDKKNISVIPHGPLDFHLAEGWDGKTARKEMNIKQGEKVILLFGAVRPYKGLKTAIGAFAKVVGEVPEARLVIAGKLWEEWGPYEEHISGLGIGSRVHTCLQYIDSDTVGKYFTAADLVLLPYHHFSSQSGVGAMAVSFRKPLIVTRTGGLTDLVKDPRSVVPPKDEQALAEALISCLKKPGRLEAMGREAALIADRIAWPAIAKRTLSVYTHILER